MFAKTGIRKFFVFATVMLGLAIGVVYYSVPAVKWRVDVLALKASGRIDGVTFGELSRMILPGSGYWLQPLAETRNPYSSIANPRTSPDDILAGQAIYEQGCQTCHGAGGAGDSAPALTRQNYTHGDSDWSLFTVIRDGLDGTAMVPSDLQEHEIWSVISFARSIQQSPSTILDKDLPEIPLVTSQMLQESAESPENWLTYSGAYNGQRFSKLNQITNENANQLAVSWIHQFNGTERMHETSPVVVDGTMYVTEAPNTIHALDAENGELLWTYSYSNANDPRLCCGQVNRGVAIRGHTLFMGTLDSHLVAVNALNGQLKWEVELHDYRLGSSITGAPLVVDDKVLVGYGGGEFGLRGFMDAISPVDGTRLWRLFTIPAEGEPGNESWGGNLWKTGGAPTWLTGSYDHSNGLVYWPTGNPSPDFRGDLRPGDNLYSNSVLAIEKDTGKLVWHFQFTPHDEHDWDANQIPVLVDREWRGENRRLLMTANRNGFFYVLDRDTGEFLLAKEFAKQNWALAIDSDGRPVINPDTVLTVEGTTTWPSPNGATNWQSPTYSPETGLFVVSALEYGQVVFKNANETQYEAGELFLGGGQRAMPGKVELYFAVRAIDPETGEIVWEYKNPTRKNWWKTGGLVSTQGNIVFGGDDTDAFILDAATGEELWRKNIGGRINAAPVTYEVDGNQYLTIAAGRSIVALSITSPD